MNNLYPKGHKKNTSRRKMNNLKVTSRRKMNKLGDGKIVSLYWFLILFLVAAGVVYMVALFYGNPYDVRYSESRALSNRIANCISVGGVIEKSFLEGEINLLEKCNLNFDVEESYGWTGESEYYIKVEIFPYNLDTYVIGSEITSNLEVGSVNLQDYCKEEFSSSNFPVCDERGFYGLGDDGSSYLVNVVSIVRKTEKNVQ